MDLSQSDIRFGMKFVEMNELKHNNFVVFDNSETVIAQMLKEEPFTRKEIDKLTDFKRSGWGKRISIL